MTFKRAYITQIVNSGFTLNVRMGQGVTLSVRMGTCLTLNLRMGPGLTYPAYDLQTCVRYTDREPSLI